MQKSRILRMILVSCSLLFCIAKTNPKVPTIQQLQRLLSYAGKDSTLETGPEILPPDQGFLGCAENVLAPPFRHDNTLMAFQNLLKNADPLGEAVIIGHGGSGVLCTGEGDGCSGNDAVSVAYYNPTAWQNIAQTFAGHSQSLTILACDVGRGNNGADLLYALAKAIQRPVRAPDAEVQCGPDGITFPDGATWVEATPTSRPSPSPIRVYSVQPTSRFKFKINGKLTDVSISQLKVVEFQHRTFRQREFQTFRNLEPAAVVRLIDFGQPFETLGRPAAIVTGTLRVQLILNNETVDKRLALYNDELVEDLTEPDVFYHADQLRVSDYIAQLDHAPPK